MQKELADNLQARKKFNELKNPTIKDLFDSGLFSFNGRLSSPFGGWHCPACWMDYSISKYSESSKP